MIVGATFTGADVAESLHAATIAVVGEVPLERLWHAVPASRRAARCGCACSRNMASEQELVDRLRAGDEDAFAELVRRYHRLMLRVARGYVRSNAVADNVAIF